MLNILILNVTKISLDIGKSNSELRQAKRDKISVRNI